MAPISSITLTSALQSLGGVSQTSAPEPAVGQEPAFQDTLTTQGRAYALGLGIVHNNGNLDALFAEIATKFGVETAKATDYAEAAEDAKRSTSLSAAAGNLAFFASLDATIQAAQANIAEQNRIIAEKTQQINELSAQKTALQDLYDTYRSEYTSNAGQQFENAAKIAALGTELAFVEIGRATACGIDSGSSACQDLTAQVNDLNAQIDGLESWNAELFARNLFLDGEMIKLEGQIIDLTFQIAGLELDIIGAKISIALSEAEIGLAEGLLGFFALVLIPFSVDLALRTINEGGQASFEMTPNQAGLDKAIGDAADNIADQAARMGASEAARKALEQLPADDPTRLDAIEAALAGTRTAGADGPNDPVTDALLGLVAALRQLIGNGQASMAGSLSDSASGSGISLSGVVQRALADNLPEGAGDPQKVTNVAAGLGGGLALLRNILGQVAGGEPSQGTQVPGASGRLTLAI